MVELKKELPEIFEEFAEQRKNSFLAIKEVKEKEIPVVGILYLSSKRDSKCHGCSSCRIMFRIR